MPRQVGPPCLIIIIIIIIIIITIAVKIPACWLAIVYKSTDNKSNVRCNVRIFSTETKAAILLVLFFRVIVK